jgi:UDP-3-O-[3-hydroxymyristoyl] N-acetylglucosamine deacetylase
VNEAWSSRRIDEEAVRVEGPSLFGGALVAATLRPWRGAEVPERGWRLLDGAGSELFRPGDLERGRVELSVRRTTWLSRNAPAFRLGVVEHLAAALTLATLDGGAWEVLCEGEELPILDGSALPWWSALQGLCGDSSWLGSDKIVAPFLDPRPARIRTRIPTPTPTPTWLPIPAGSLSTGGAEASWEPCDRFVAEVEWEQGEHSGQSARLHQRVLWDSSCDDPAEIVCARTFISSAELRRAQAAGLLTQAREGQGIVWEGGAGACDTRGDTEQREGDVAAGRSGAGADSTPSLVVGAPLRHPQEMAMHKLLDLIGDLGLGRPGLPGVHLRVRNGGHQLNHLLLRRFLNVPA